MLTNFIILKRPAFLIGLLALLCPIIISKSALALEKNFQEVSTPRFTLFISDFANQNDNTYKNILEFSERTIRSFETVSDEIDRILSHTAENHVVLRFLTPEEFQSHTGAPTWTSAMFFRGEISVPVSPNIEIPTADLNRTLKHEYVHAVVSELSAQRAPAWLDEGLAQLLEGAPNTVLGPALRNWIKTNDAMPLSWLHHGFLSLNKEVVPAAYAQSLFVTRMLVNSYGISGVKIFLNRLGDGEEYNSAFTETFGKSPDKFESSLTQQIKCWAASTKKDP